VTAGSDRGVVLSGTGGVWQVRLEDGAVIACALRGRLKQPRRDDDAPEPLKLAVGDAVRVDGDGVTHAITEILPRHSKLARRAPGAAFGERVLAANVDQVVIMFAAANPEPHVRMLDRFLVIAEANHLAARVVVNKLELVGEGAARERFADYERAGYPVHYTSVKRETGLEALRDALAGRTSVFTGPSGVGKSSMLNALFPGSGLRVGEISASVNKGRHTTVGSVMLPLPSPPGGFVVDTPGLREVGIAELPGEPLDRCFPELRSLVDNCRFADCSHVHEPDCAVRDAVRDGSVSTARYESYLSLLEGS
jgi:ribosome biogenesis GTPase